jgi:hypothetical protein
MGEEQFLNEIINLPLHTVGHALDERPEDSWNRPRLKQVHHVSGRGQCYTKGIVTKVYLEESVVTKVSRRSLECLSVLLDFNVLLSSFPFSSSLFVNRLQVQCTYPLAAMHGIIQFLHRH